MLAPDFGADAAPILDRYGIAEMHANVFEDVQRCGIDPLDLRAVHHLAQWNPARETRQHCVVWRTAQGAAGRAPARARAGLSIRLSYLFLRRIAAHYVQAMRRAAYCDLQKPT